MWLITPIGFFSIVQKDGDAANETLTVRARVRADLDALRVTYLPELGPTVESELAEYPFRAIAPRGAVARAAGHMFTQLDYASFHEKIVRVHGRLRAVTYRDAGDILRRLQGAAG